MLEELAVRYGMWRSDYEQFMEETTPVLKANPAIPFSEFHNEFRDRWYLLTPQEKKCFADKAIITMATTTAQEFLKEEDE